MLFYFYLFYLETLLAIVLAIIRNPTRDDWMRNCIADLFQNKYVAYFNPKWNFFHFKIFSLHLCTKSLENHPKKLHTYGSCEFFFSAASTAQNSPELHFRFMNSFIQPSLVGSLVIIDLFWWNKCFHLLNFTKDQ